MKVPYFDFSHIPDHLRERYVEVFETCLKTDRLIDGENCRRFEEAFGSYLGVNHVVGVGNGFDALRIGLLALGIGDGDLVAVPAHTFIATWFAIESIGAIPVGIDVTSDGQINLDELEMKRGLKCVVPVHMHGTHCDMKRLTTWAIDNNILVLEDCAQAAGLDIQGKKAGTWGNVGIFSFYPTKNLFCLGDGGAIVSNSQMIVDLARSISRYGQMNDDKYRHIRLGQNSRLDTIQSAFLTINLENLDSDNKKREAIANHFKLSLSELVVPPQDYQKHVYHHFIVHVGDKRDSIRKLLKDSGVETEVHYPVPAYEESRFGKDSIFHMAQRLSQTTLSLPINIWQGVEKSEEVVLHLEKVLLL